MDDGDLLRQSWYWSEDQLILLGRVVELSAYLESRWREILGLALGLRADLVDVLLLGVRFSELRRRLQALQLRSPWLAGDWLPEVIVVAKAAAATLDQRDALLHRPVSSSWGSLELRPARTSQKNERVEGQLLDLVRNLMTRGREADRLYYEVQKRISAQ